MTYRVKLTGKARRDLNNIFEWLTAQHAGEAGLRWFFRLEEAIESLSDMPQRCGVAPETARFPFEVRQLVYGRKPHFYRVLFVIEADTVWVLHVRHGRRLPVKR